METRKHKASEEAEYPTFEEAWKKYVTKLVGKSFKNTRGENKITAVTGRGVQRTTISENPNNWIPIEHFRSVYNDLIEKGTIIRKELTAQKKKWCSSGVVWILGQLPFIALETEPYIKLTLK
ncbi:MAG: hypothetical protein NC396_03785 [Bacteroides sp.]|nr:hypothetical protein [Bacteroides sp.]MCM1085346.1 hypothetical protein [Bacteroides sp.]